MIYSLIVIFMFALILSLMMTKFCTWFSFKIAFLDIPLKLARKNHKKSTPLLGGPAIFISFFITVFALIFIATDFYEILDSFFPQIGVLLEGVKLQLKTLFFIFISSGLILLLGIKDDKDGMNPLPKLLGLILISLLLFYLNIRITIFISFPLVSFICTLMWILFLTNAFNLLDNMDGSCTFIAISCSISLLLVAILMEQYFICFYLVALLGVLFGFLKTNFFGGKIFLGDSGALFIGFNLAVITILESFYIVGKSSVFSIVLPLFIFIIPIYDTTSVIYIRLKNKKPIYKGDLNHITHRINNYGLSKKMTVVFLTLISTTIGIVSTIILFKFHLSLVSSIILFLIIFIIVVVFEKSFRFFKRVDN